MENKTMPTLEKENQQTEAAKPAKSIVELGNFGNGRYSPVMSELYGDTQRLLGFNKHQAHVTSARLGIDLGRLGAGKAAVTFGKTTNKDGYRTVREVCSVKLPNSWALSVAVVCNGLDTLRKQGLQVVENTIHDSLLEYVNEAAARIEAKPVE